MKWHGKLTTTGEAVEVQVSEGKIIKVTPSGHDTQSLPWLSAGWIDLQVNGFGGFDLNSVQTTAADLDGVTSALHTRGVASYMPTLITGSYERMHQAMTAVASYCRSEQSGAASILGIHMEGPYLSSEDGSRGAHPSIHTRDPDWEEFQRLQDAAQGRIRMVTLAPERSGAIPFIERLVEQGVVVAIGHTMATAEQLDQAVEAGATISTHLGNGSQTMLPRHPNYIWHQLADDRLWGAFIPDGHHLAPSVLKAMIRVKGNRSVLVSDTTRFGGMAPGQYDSLIGGQVMLRADGRLHTMSNPDILAGSAASLDSGIANTIRYTDMQLAEAVEAASLRPAQVMGVADQGQLESGQLANLTLFDYEEAIGEITVRETVVQGKSAYHRTL